MERHRIPDDLTPTGDLRISLLIPHDPQWVGLLLGVLKTLEEVEYYQRDPNFDDENAQVVVAQWRDRTITPLIEAIASGSTMKAYRLHKLGISSQFNSSSLTFVPVTNSGFSHTFTYANARIRAYNVSVTNSTSGQGTIVYPEIQGLLGHTDIGQSEGTGVGVREHTSMIQYNNAPVGVAQTIRLMMQVTGGIGTINQNSHILYEIEEWE
jgi:hypothetical protein